MKINNINSDNVFHKSTIYSSYTIQHRTEYENGYKNSMGGANIAEHIKHTEKADFLGIFRNTPGKSHQFIKIYKHISFTQA